MSEGRPKRGLPRAAIALAACAGLAALATPGVYAPVGSAALAADDGGVREVARTTSGYSVHANYSEMPRLLRALGDEAGFTVLDTGKFQLPITFSIDDAPLDVALRRILRDANFIIVYRGGKRGTEISPDGIEQIILLSPAGATQGKQAPPASPLAGPHVANGAPSAPGQGQAMPPPARAHRLRGRDDAPTNPEAYPPGLAPGPHAPNVAMPPEVAGGMGQPTYEELTEGAIGMAGAAGAVEAMPPDDATIDPEE